MMEIEQILPLVSRWLHILAAIALVGGMIFVRIAVVPARLSGECTDTTSEFVRKRWARVVSLSVLFLLVSGLYNAYQKAIQFELDAVYLSLLSLKVVFAFLIFYLASLLAGRSQRARQIRDADPKWTNIALTLMILVILMAGYMKISQQTAKDSSSKIGARVFP